MVGGLDDLNSLTNVFVMRTPSKISYRTRTACSRSQNYYNIYFRDSR